MLSSLPVRVMSPSLPATDELRENRISSGLLLVPVRTIFPIPVDSTLPPSSSRIPGEILSVSLPCRVMFPLKELTIESV